MANKRAVGRGSRDRNAATGRRGRRSAHLKWAEKAYRHLSFWWMKPYNAGWSTLPSSDFTGQLVAAMQAVEKIIGKRAAERIHKKVYGY